MKNLTYLFALSILLPLASFSQTGPGGVGNATNNVIWLDGNVLTYSTVPSLSAWPDQSGNGNDFSQATSSRQPIRVTYPHFTGVRFNGSSNWLRAGGIGALNSNTNTQYIVYNGNTANHIGVLYDGSFTESNQFYRTYRSNANVKSWVLNNVGGVVYNTTTNSSAFQIVSSVWDGGAQTYSSYKDGSLILTKAGANGNPTGNYANTLGAAYNKSYKFNGDMGEVIIYNSVLNSAQRKIVDNYLSSKFGVAISNDMYAYDATHRHQVIGIGQEADGNNLVAQGKGIVQLSSPSLNNGDYVFTGHDNVSLTTNTNDLPIALLGGSRLSRTWRVGVQGTPGAVDVVFDISSLTLPTGSYYLLVDPDGTFNDLNGTTYGPFADVAGLVTFSGISLADGDYFTIASAVPVGIFSIQSGSWSSSSTWNCACVPGATDDVTITTGHTVNTTVTAAVNDITIDGYLTTLATSSFSVKGNYTVNATGSAAHKTIFFSGTTTQNVTNNSSGTISLGSLRINNSSNVVLTAGKFTIPYSVSLLAGQLQNTGATCTLESNATRTCVIINSAAGNGFSGQFILQRYVPARTANWADLSSPVSNATLGEWDSNPSGTVTELWMSGVNGIDGTAGAFVSVKSFDAATQLYVDITDTNTALIPGKSLDVWLADDLSTFNAKTFDTRGTPNFGDVAVSVANSWNMIGNPYQAWVNWTGITKPTLSGTYYMYNDATSSYDAKTGGSIPPHQGVFVESTGAGTVTFKESSKASSGSSTFYRTNGEDFSFPSIDDPDMMNAGGEPYDFTEVKLKIKSNAYPYSHELKLRLNYLAQIGADEFDASFLKSRLEEAPSITSHSANDSKKLAINSFNYQDEVLIPIAVKVGISGEHIIEPINFDALKDKYQFMELIDNKTSKVYNLNYQTKGGITFEINKGDDPERFTLRLSNLASNSATVSEVISIYKTNENTVIEFDNTDENYEIAIYNAIGQKVMENSYANFKNKILISNDKFPHGINIITVRSTKDVVVKKITY